jgi:hypothetical protein
MGALIFFVVWFGGGYALGRYWCRKGHNKVLSILGAGALSFVVGAVIGALVDGGAPPPATPPTAALPAAAPAPAPVAPRTVAPAKAPAAKTPAAKDFGITLDQYVAEVNAMLRADKIRGPVKAVKKKGAKRGAYAIDLPSKRVAGRVWTDAVSGRVTGVMVMASSPDGRHADKALDDRYAVVDLISAVRPHESRGSLVADMEDMRLEAGSFGVVAKRADDAAVVSYAMTSLGVMATIDLGTLPPPADHGDKSFMAYIQCKAQLKAQLKAPASAEFPPGPDQLLRDRYQPDSYAMVSHVDAQNSYGALLRAGWSCAATYTGQGDDADASNWTFHNVALEDAG